MVSARSSKSWLHDSLSNYVDIFKTAKQHLIDALERSKTLKIGKKALKLKIVELKREMSKGEEVYLELEDKYGKKKTKLRAKANSDLRKLLATKGSSSGPAPSSSPEVGGSSSGDRGIKRKCEKVIYFLFLSCFFVERRDSACSTPLYSYLLFFG